MIQVGLIGKGTIGGVHENAYRRLKKEGADVLLAACCDIRPEQMAAVDVDPSRKYTDLDEFLEMEKGKLDYVDICLPTYLHAEAAIKAMRAGFNVLSEKPMAISLELAREMVAVSEETGRKLMVAHCCRFGGAAPVLREIIASGEMGRIRSAEFFREGGGTGPMGYKNWFRDGKLSGGAMLDLHIHDVDMINWLFGRPKSVSAAAIQIITDGGYDAMSVNFEYDGFFVNAKSDWTIAHDKFNTRCIRANFEKGYVYCDNSPGRKTFVKVNLDGSVEDLSERRGDDMYYVEICYYAKCLAAGVPVEDCMPAQSAEAVEIVMAEMKSADHGGERVAL